MIAETVRSSPSRPSPGRLSPIHSSLSQIPGHWTQINQMPVLAAVDPERRDSSPAQVQICDLSCLTRFGLKGAGAADWLHQQGLPVPNQPNRWLPLETGLIGTGPLETGLIARLGLTEFLIEDGFQRQRHLAQRLDQTQPPRVYPVLRQDLALALWGPALLDLLAQTCSINFRTLPAQSLVLTSMVGVSVTLLAVQSVPSPYYRLWCDGTYGEYLWQTLRQIAQELGGEVVGIEAVRQKEQTWEDEEIRG